MNGDELLAAVYDAPDDDAPRAVYADWLHERGDPLGELIALQLAPATSASLRRQATLIKAHREAWLGPLWHVVNRQHLIFERGFVSRVRLRPKISGKRLLEAAGDRRWATVRELDLWGFAYGALVLSDAMRGLSRLLSVPPALAISMLREGRPRSLRELEIGGDTAWQFELRSALQSSRMPELRHLALRLNRDEGPDALAWLWDSPLGARLESFALPYAGTPSPAWRTSTAIPRNITAVYFGEGPLDIATLRRGPSGLLDQLEEPAR